MSRFTPTLLLVMLVHHTALAQPATESAEPTVDPAASVVAIDDDREAGSSEGAEPPAEREPLAIGMQVAAGTFGGLSSIATWAFAYAQPEPNFWGVGISMALGAVVPGLLRFIGGDENEAMRSWITGVALTGIAAFAGLLFAVFGPSQSDQLTGPQWGALPPAIFSMAFGMAGI